MTIAFGLTNFTRGDVMINRKNIIKALVVSLVLTLLLSVGSAVLFSSGFAVDPALDWEKVNAMPYAEATAHIARHTKEMSSWDTLTTYIQWHAFITPAFFALMASLFVGCAALLWWVGNDSAK